jgi:glycosyltransferase involved in cell wall biosynthesis
MNRLVTINVILPVYNPPADWDILTLSSCYFIREQAPLYDWQFHFVNDGSTNGRAFQKLRDIKLHFIHVHEYAKNKGKGFAVRHGIQKAKPATLYMYSDWDFPFGEGILIEAIHKLKHCDIVVANRGTAYYNHLPKTRLTLTQIQRFINLYALKLKQIDTQAGFKAFNQTGKTLLMETTINEFLFDTEFIAIGQKVGLDMDNIEVTCRKDITFTNFRPSTLLKELANMPKIFLARYARQYTLDTDYRLRRV